MYIGGRSGDSGSTYHGNRNTHRCCFHCGRSEPTAGSALDEDYPTTEAGLEKAVGETEMPIIDKALAIEEIGVVEGVISEDVIADTAPIEQAIDSISTNDREVPESISGEVVPDNEPSGVGEPTPVQEGADPALIDDHAIPETDTRTVANHVITPWRRLLQRKLSLPLSHGESQFQQKLLVTLRYRFSLNRMRLSSLRKKFSLLKTILVFREFMRSAK
jgi:hypothetical protein